MSDPATTGDPPYLVATKPSTEEDVLALMGDCGKLGCCVVDTEGEAWPPGTTIYRISMDGANKTYTEQKLRALVGSNQSEDH